MTGDQGRRRAPGVGAEGSRGDGRRDRGGRERGPARAAGQQQRTAAAPSARRKGADVPRGVAFDVLRAVAASDSYANLVLPPMLRDRGLQGRDAGFTTELAYGTLRLHGRYDAIIEQCAARSADSIDGPVLDLLRLGVHQLLGMRVPAHAAVSETVGLTRERVGTGASQFVNAVLRAVSRVPLETWLERIGDAADPDGTDPLARLAVTQSHPAWIVRAMRTCHPTMQIDHQSLTC